MPAPLLDAVRPTTYLSPVKLRDRLGIDLTVASETFQHTGSFKFRAAYNVVLKVERSELLTASSGNFGQALAYACKLLNKRCTVVMPDRSARVKVDAVKAFGAEVDLIDTRQVGRLDRVDQLFAKMPQAYVASPYDDQLVIDGNATLGDELARESFDAVLCPIGGGGLISGVVTGLQRSGASARVYGVEPALGNDAARSLAAGHIITNTEEPMTIADGARTISVGDLNWPLIRDHVAEIIEVPDDTTAQALRLYFELANLKCEPTGALTLAAILLDRERWMGKRICVVVSGGNVDGDIYSRLISTIP